MNEQQYSQAVDLGEQARRAGKTRDTNPYKHGNTTLLRALRDAWESGYSSADISRRVSR